MKKDSSPKQRVYWHLTPEDFGQLCETAARGRLGGERFADGVEFADCIKVMAYGGSLPEETLGLKWANVDWERRQLTIDSVGAGGHRSYRIVDFNTTLEEHLKEMLVQKVAVPVLLFPALCRAGGDQPAAWLEETMRRVRKEAGLPQFEFENLRHYFRDHCRGLEIDYMTIARWMLDRRE